MTLFIADFNFGTPAYDESIRLRYAILKEPLAIKFSMNALNQEYANYHLGAYNSAHSLIACLMLVPLDKGVFHMRQVAVVEALQGKGIGSELVRASEILAKENGGKKMILNARDTALEFYKKMEYEVVGEEFEEVGIPHFRMEKGL